MSKLVRKRKVIKRKSVDNKSTIMTKTEAENAQLELDSIKQSKKALDAREAELKTRLSEYMEKALPPDSKGHRLFTVMGADGQNRYLQRQARKKISLDQERAKAYLVEKGMEDLIVQKQVIAKEVTEDQLVDVVQVFAPQYVDVKEVIDEAALEQAVLAEEIPMEDFEGLCDIKTTYAMTYLKPEQVEEAAQAEEALEQQKED